MIYLIYGKLDGIRNTIIEKLETVYEITVPKYNIFNVEIASIISEVTAAVNREISVAIDRKGKVINVAIGDSCTVEMPEVDIKEKKLSGVRIIHTHPNGIAMLSALDISALLKLKLDSIVAIGVKENKITDVSIGFCTVRDDILIPERTKLLSIEEAISYDFLDNIHYTEEILKKSSILEDNTEKAILVGIEDEESLEELSELAKACGVKVVERVFQKN